MSSWNPCKDHRAACDHSDREEGDHDLGTAIRLSCWLPYFDGGFFAGPHLSRVFGLPCISYGRSWPARSSESEAGRGLVAHQSIAVVSHIQKTLLLPLGALSRSRARHPSCAQRRSFTLVLSAGKLSMMSSDRSSGTCLSANWLLLKLLSEIKNTGSSSRPSIPLPMPYTGW